MGSITLYLIRVIYIKIIRVQIHVSRRKLRVLKIPVHLRIWFVFVCLFDVDCLFKTVIWLLVQIENNTEACIPLHTFSYSLSWCTYHLFNQEKLSTIEKKMGLIEQTQLLPLQEALSQCPFAQSTYLDVNHTFGVFCSLCKPLVLCFHIFGILLFAHLSLPVLEGQRLPLIQRSTPGPHTVFST